MLHLLKYNLKVKLKNFGMTFWPLAFPLILGTLFYFILLLEISVMRIFRPYLWLWWKKHMQIRCSLHFWIRSKEARINFCQWKK